MFKTIFLLLPALLAGNALADTVEFCPSPGDIHNSQGVLTAKTQGGHGQWVGVSPDPMAKVTAFEGAIFYPAADQVEAVGRLRACAYSTSKNQTVDMRYRPEVTPDIAIRVAYPQAWQRQEGPFGISYFQCRQQELQGCAFKEAR